MYIHLFIPNTNKPYTQQTESNFFWYLMESKVDGETGVDLNLLDVSKNL